MNKTLFLLLLPFWVIRFAEKMRKVLFVLVLALGFTGCAEREDLPDPCSNIAGTWSCENSDVFGRSRSYVYMFGEGFLLVFQYDGGTLLSENRYAYTCSDGSMDLLNVATQGTQTATLSYPDPDTCMLDLFGMPTITLKRMQ